MMLKDKNGGNPWPPTDLANAMNVRFKTNSFFYITAGSRDYGFTIGTKFSKTISLSEVGRKLVYAGNSATEKEIKSNSFLKIEVFKKVFEYYKGGNLPEMKYLSNTLESQFKLPKDTHEEFSKIFKANCDYLGIGTSIDKTPLQNGESQAQKAEVITMAEPEKNTGLTCFVIMPFKERDSRHSEGFFNEVLQSLIVPAGRNAGFKVTTANRQGSDVIQSTIINDLLNADLVLADLTEHNPNVLFELGMRMAHDKPIVLIRSKGTSAIFDVDNMLRVFDYDANLWSTTIEKDIPKLSDHIKASWGARDSDKTYLKILKGQGQTK